MDLTQFLALRGEDHQFNTAKEWRSFRRKRGLGWYSTSTEVPHSAKPLPVNRLPACIKSGFPPGAITRAWRSVQPYNAKPRYYLQDTDGDFQSVA